MEKAVSSLDKTVASHTSWLAEVDRNKSQDFCQVDNSFRRINSEVRFPQYPWPSDTDTTKVYFVAMELPPPQWLAISPGTLQLPGIHPPPAAGTPTAAAGGSSSDVTVSEAKWPLFAT